MSDDPAKYVFRRPRHFAGRTTELRVEVERPAGHQPAVLQAELVNLSRDGFQLRIALPLEVEEPVTLRLRDEKSGFSMTLPGIVRWRHREDGDTCLLGCSSASQVAWETLGELFLHEILATGPAAD